MLTDAYLRSIVSLALEEDAPWGDLTSDAIVPEHSRSTAVMVAREPGVMAGGNAAELSFVITGPDTSVHIAVDDGKRFDSGDVLIRIEGRSRAILRAERVALNLTQRMCGIATATSRYVQAVAGTNARIVDTRKTTPGLRQLEKYAVVCGGGHNHRASLSDAVLVKDNHLATVSAAGLDLTEVLRAAKHTLPHTCHIEVEVDRIDQIDAVLAAEVDSILLDNFSLVDLRAAVAKIGRRVLVEASGGVTLETVRDIAETGVDIISIGAITHSVRALDLGLDMQEQR